MPKSENKQQIKEKLISAFGLAEDIMLEIPKITILGDKTITIENYKGIIEYEENIIRINTKIGQISVLGINFDIKNLTKEELTLEGTIQKIEIS